MIDVDAVARAALERLEARSVPVRVAVLGDVMLDQFLYGAVERISPEAPVPVVEVDREVFRLGGAANVVHNLRALGAAVELFGVVGRDAAGVQIRDELGRLGVRAGGLVETDDRPTAVKTRVIAQHQQVVRFDRERRAPLGEEVLSSLRELLVPRLGEVDAVIISDYGKGVVSSTLMGPLIEGARRAGVLLAVDPKPVNVGQYRGVTVLTPNVKETEAMADAPVRSDEEAAAAGRRLLTRLGSRAVLVTRGDRGMTLVEDSGQVAHLPTRARDVFDVTGAGDTAISVLALAWAAGAPPVQAACLANLAAGIVVGKLGTAVASVEELRGAASHGNPNPVGSART
ncbi:MAG: D-glycero-beta-D-manno-heptose-7-phosphate kinase [Deferrisomatales bacterium]|nr:D-glycero-beta-D-manno-heptose-7-phosphate kinase [Deferrisomatales bacterium]